MSLLGSVPIADASLSIEVVDVNTEPASTLEEYATNDAEKIRER